MIREPGFFGTVERAPKCGRCNLLPYNMAAWGAPSRCRGPVVLRRTQHPFCCSLWIEVDSGGGDMDPTFQ